MIRELSDGEATGTRDRAFRTITSLLYEAVTGETDADLKRMCDQVLSDEMPIGTDTARKNRSVCTHPVRQRGKRGKSH